MAIIKLVCQGCGANLDAIDDRRVIQCGYCGASNQIRETVQPRPAPAQPPPSAAPARAPIQFQYTAAPTPVVQPPSSSGAGRGILVFVIIMALLPLIIGGVVAYMVTGSAEHLLERATSAFTPGYSWVSARPFVVDVDDDGSEDIIGLVQPFGDQRVELRVISGAGFTPIWSVELGLRSDMPNAKLRYEPSSQLLLFELGTAVHAYDPRSGTQRWVASLPDQIGTVAVDGQRLWVATIDEQTQYVGLADGTLEPAPKQPGDDAKPLRDDGIYELIPELGQLDLNREQFADTRIEQAFCPLADLPVHVGRRNDEAKRCANPHGLAWVNRSKGTRVPFLIGYARADKTERWRVQLTTAGSIETVESGFSQPRAEFFGDDAIVSFTPSSDKLARVRRISLLDGSVRWEVSLPAQPAAWVNGMVVGRDKLAVQYGQTLRVFDLADGRQLAELGA